MSNQTLFSRVHLPGATERRLSEMNPWWEGKALPVLPVTRRRLVEQIHHRLSNRLAPIVVVRGPRQIGKTTAQLHVVSDLIDRGTPPTHIIRVQWDDLAELASELRPSPVLEVVKWFEEVILKKTLNRAAHDHEPTFLFMDEVQNLDRWAEQLKSLVDHTTTQVVVTGSSALRIEIGRDSLAGRITTIEAGVLSLTEIATFRGDDLGQPFLADNGLEPLANQDFWRSLRDEGVKRSSLRDKIFADFAERGGYPIAHERAAQPWSLIADQLNENVIRRVIRHDLRLGERGRKRDAALLEEVFRLACRYAGTAPGVSAFVRETQQSLGANVGPQRISTYLRFLDDTLLLRLVQPLEIRLKRKRGHAKICLADHALRASWLQEVVPLSPAKLEAEPHLTDMAGHLAESIVGATLKSIASLDVNYFPSRQAEPEVDFVTTIGLKRVPIEVKYQKRIDPLRDTAGLRSFLEKAANNAPFGILVTLTDGVSVTDPRIVALPLSSFMLLR